MLETSILFIPHRKKDHTMVYSRGIYLIHMTAHIFKNECFVMKTMTKKRKTKRSLSKRSFINENRFKKTVVFKNNRF